MAPWRHLTLPFGRTRCCKKPSTKGRQRQMSEVSSMELWVYQKLRCIYIASTNPGYDVVSLLNEKSKRKYSKQTHDICRFDDFSDHKTWKTTRLRDELSCAERSPGSSHLCCFQRGLKAFSGGTKGDHGWWWFLMGALERYFFYLSKGYRMWLVGTLV